MGTWMHRGEEVKFIGGNVSMQRKVVKHNEWRITYIDSKNEKGNYSCCPNETFPSVRFTIYMERHSESEATFILAPALILATLSLVSLWLDPNCSERILLNVISTFSHFIYLQQLSWLVPKNGMDVPDVVIYFRDSMVIATVLLVDTIIKRGLLSSRSAMPAWVKSTTNSLRGNKIGQLMFTNPYLINKVPLNNESTSGEDAANLVEAQPTEESEAKTKVEERNVWCITVRVLDTLMFVVLLITYVILVIGWVHVGYVSSQKRYTAEVKKEIPDDDD